MALTTRNQRKAVMALGMPFMPALPVPDGSDLEDRQERAMLLGLMGMEVPVLNYGSSAKRRGMSFGMRMGM